MQFLGALLVYNGIGRRIRRRQRGRGTSVMAIPAPLVRVLQVCGSSSAGGGSRRAPPDNASGAMASDGRRDRQMPVDRSNGRFARLTYRSTESGNVGTASASIGADETPYVGSSARARGEPWGGQAPRFSLCKQALCVSIVKAPAYGAFSFASARRW